MASRTGRDVTMIRPTATPNACDRCKKRKIRCSGGPGPCSKCSQAEAQCVFATEPKTRRPPARSGRRIDGLESRLERLEAMLRDSQQSPHNASIQNAVEGLTPSSMSLPALEESTPWAMSPDSSNEIGLEKRSPRKADALPTFDEAIRQAKVYFSTVNQHLPLFEESTFMQDVLSHWPVEKNDPASYAASNVVLALASRADSTRRDTGTGSGADAAHLYLQNATSAVHDLITQTPTLLGAQALVGIAQLIQASPTPCPASNYLAIASRHIYKLGLQKLDSENSNDNKISQQQQSLLRLAYSLDKDICLRQDQPHIFNDQDVTLPTLTGFDDIGTISALTAQHPRINYFRLHTDLAVIQSNIYNFLHKRPINIPQRFNCDPTNQTNPTVCTLVQACLDWRSTIPFDFSPDVLLVSLPTASIPPMVTLHLRYFNCIATLLGLTYWKVAHLEQYKDTYADIFINPCPTKKFLITLARKSLYLFPLIPHGDDPYMWLLVDHFVSAAVIMLAGVIYGSLLSEGAADLDVVKPVIEDLEVMAKAGDSERLNHIRRNCEELMRAARSVLER